MITRDGGICSVDSVAWMVIIGERRAEDSNGLNNYMNIKSFLFEP